MSRLRTYGLAAAFLVLLGGNATAASRDDDSRDGLRKFFSQIKQRIVRILEDIRPTSAGLVAMWCPPAALRYRSVHHRRDRRVYVQATRPSPPSTRPAHGQRRDARLPSRFRLSEDPAAATRLPDRRDHLRCEKVRRAPQRRRPRRWRALSLASRPSNLIPCDLRDSLQPGAGRRTRW